MSTRMNVGGRFFSLEENDQDKLKRALMQLRVGTRLTIQGSGISVKARAGVRRMFDLDIPMNVPNPPHGLELRSLKSATEAAEQLMKLHVIITKQQQDEANAPE